MYMYMYIYMYILYVCMYVCMYVCINDHKESIMTNVLIHHKDWVTYSDRTDKSGELGL